MWKGIRFAKEVWKGYGFRKGTVGVGVGGGGRAPLVR